MGAEVFGGRIPATVTLDDLAAMNAADPSGHRYELTPEGALWVLPPADSDHAAIATRIMIWLAMAGWPGDQILQAVGVKVPGATSYGGRIPDITLWSASQARAVWLPLDDLILAVEIISPASAVMDQVMKVHEYAAAGIPRYWVVDRDAAQTVTMYAAGTDGAYEITAKMPLAWLLQTEPAEHGFDI